MSVPMRTFSLATEGAASVATRPDAEPTGEDGYANIRSYLGYLIGKRLVDITQHSLAEWQEEGEAYVMLLFEDGSWLKFSIGDDNYFDHAEG